MRTMFHLKTSFNIQISNLQSQTNLTEDLNIFFLGSFLSRYGGSCPAANTVEQRQL